MVVTAGATIGGQVTGLAPGELGGVNVFVRGPDKFRAVVSPNPEGVYVVHGVPTGRVEVVAETPSLRTVAKWIDVPEGASELDLSIEFEAEPAHLGG